MTTIKIFLKKKLNYLIFLVITVRLFSGTFVSNFYMFVSISEYRGHKSRAEA